MTDKTNKIQATVKYIVQISVVDRLKPPPLRVVFVQPEPSSGRNRNHVFKTEEKES